MQQQQIHAAAQAALQASAAAARLAHQGPPAQMAPGQLLPAGMVPGVGAGAPPDYSVLQRMQLQQAMQSQRGQTFVAAPAPRGTPAPMGAMQRSVPVAGRDRQSVEGVELRALAHLDAAAPKPPASLPVDPRAAALLRQSHDAWVRTAWVEELLGGGAHSEAHAGGWEAGGAAGGDNNVPAATAAEALRGRVAAATEGLAREGRRHVSSPANPSSYPATSSSPGNSSVEARAGDAEAGRGVKRWLEDGGGGSGAQSGGGSALMAGLSRGGGAAGGGAAAGVAEAEARSVGVRWVPEVIMREVRAPPGGWGAGQPPAECFVMM